MFKIVLTILLYCGLLLPAFAQESTPRKGVTYWGQPAAHNTYNAPSRPAVTAPTARVATPSVKGTDLNFDVMSQGTKYRSIVHLPKRYDPNTPMPVILVFHGMGMHANQMPLLTMMHEPAERYGFILVYPDAGDGRWDDGFTGADKGDVDFVAQLINTLPKVANIDRDRVYACGISNGGFFCQRLACDLPNKIKGIAIVAATGFHKVCGRCNWPAMPVMFFLGTEDPLIPYDDSHNLIAGAAAEKLGLGDIRELSGGLTQLGGMYSGPQAIQYWVQRNAVGRSPRSNYLPHRGHDPTRVLLEDYGGGRNQVAAYIIENGGHTWPGSLAGVVIDNHVRLGRTTQDIDASELICQFFASH